MHVQEISVERVKNLGNYESIRLTASASLDEGDDVDKTIEDIKFYLDYKLNEDIRSSKADEIQKELEDGVDSKGRELTEVGIKARKEWFDKYDEERDKFLALDFVHG